MTNDVDVDEDLVFPGDEDCSGDRSESSGDDSDVTGAENTKAGSEKQGEIAKNETKAVLHLKFVVLIVLVCSAICVAVIVYKYTAGSEESLFEYQFRDDSSKVLEAIGSSLDKTLGTFDSLAVTLVSSARAANESWPFVTLPDFGVRVSKLLPLSNAVSINVLPVVTPGQRLAWEEYSLQNDRWVNESVAIQETWKDYHGPLIYDWEPNAVMHDDFDDLQYNLRYET